MRFLSRLLRRNETDPSEAAANAPGRHAGTVAPAVRPSGTPVVDRTDAAHPSAPPDAAGTDVPAESTEDAIELFEAIQEVIGPSEDIVALPCRALLVNLPKDLRGPAWRPDGFPTDRRIELDRADLLEQLHRGRVIYPLNDLCANLPDGWVRPDADALVELNLPDIIGALPPDTIRGASKYAADMQAVAGMRDFFHAHKEAPAAPAPAESAGPAVAEAPPTPPAPEPRPVAAAAPPRPARRKPQPPPGTWDGRDRQPDAGARVVDLNRANAEDLARVPGLGEARAACIVQYREANGPFHGVFDLLEMRGVGRRLFFRVTGLQSAVTKRKDRHEALNALLGFPAEERPALPRIAEGVAAQLGFAGCILAGRDGMVLAATAELGGEAERFAAIAPRFYQRAGVYLRRLGGTAGDVVILPTLQPPVLLAGTPRFYLVAVLRDGATGASMAEVGAVVEEIDWLLRPRLAVREDA